MKTNIDLNIDPHSSVPVYEQLANEMRRLICAQTFAVGEQVPSIRVLATKLSVSPTTVRRAFQILIDEGWLDQQRGSGTYIAASLDLQRKYMSGASSSGSAAEATPAIRLPAALLQNTWAQELNYLIPFEQDAKAGYTAPQRYIDDALTSSTALTDPAGSLELREQIAKAISLTRSIKCTASDIIITAGPQQARSFVARLFARQGARVVMEDPCHPITRRLFQSFNWTTVSKPIDDSGIVIEELDRIHRAEAIYLMPSSQFPTGAVLSKMRRERIAAWAKRMGALIIEDDEGSDLTYDNRVTAAIHSFADEGRCIYIGSFNLLVPESWQVAFMVVPAAMRETFYRMKLVADRCTAPILQNVLTGMWRDGHVERSLTKLQRDYGRVRDRLVEALAKVEGITVTPVKGGVRQVVWLPAAADDVSAASRCRELSLPITAVSPMFALKPARPGVMIDFSDIEAFDVNRVVEALKQCIG